MSGVRNWLLSTGPRLKIAAQRQTTLRGSLAMLILIVGWCLFVEALVQANRLLTLCRNAARELDAARGPGTARSEAIGMVIVMVLAAIIAVGIAAITGDA